MTGLRPISRLRTALGRLRRDEHGATLVEMAFVIPPLLLLLFGFIDFSRLGFTYVMAGKAMDQAVRMAVVMPPPCPNIPMVNSRGPSTMTNTRYGTSCNADTGLCSDPGLVACSAATAHPTAAAIWAQIAPLMPVNATEENVILSYEFTPDLGFLGGPYTPVVTARIEALDFQFITPLGALAGLAGATNAGTLGSDFVFPSMSASLPAEALFDGEIL